MLLIMTLAEAPREQTKNMVCLNQYSVEVTPKSAQKVTEFRELLRSDTRVYIAHINGTAINDMIACARRLRADGFPVTPHIPARSIRNAAVLREWLGKYSDLGITEALVIAGGSGKPLGEFASSMQLLETGLFQKYGFRRLYIAGHPEGNADIDADGSSRNADAALLWKQRYAVESDIELAIVTQFIFDPVPVIHWVERIRALGVALPVYVGVAGPTRLSTLLKYALSCGVGPSIQVLRRRASDLTALLSPYEPTEMLAALFEHYRSVSSSPIAGIHVFPLGGLKASVDWIDAYSPNPPAIVASWQRCCRTDQTSKLAD